MVLSNDIQRESTSLRNSLNRISEDSLLDGRDSEALQKLVKEKDSISNASQLELKGVLRDTLKRGFNVRNKKDRLALDHVLVLAGFSEGILSIIPEGIQNSPEGYIVKLNSEYVSTKGNTGQKLFVYKIDTSWHNRRDNDVVGYIDQQTRAWKDFTWNIYTRDDKMEGNNSIRGTEQIQDEVLGRRIDVSKEDYISGASLIDTSEEGDSPRGGVAGVQVAERIDPNNEVRNDGDKETTSTDSIPTIDNDTRTKPGDEVTNHLPYGFSDYSSTKEYKEYIRESANIRPGYEYDVDIQENLAGEDPEEQEYVGEGAVGTDYIEARDPEEYYNPEGIGKAVEELQNPRLIIDTPIINTYTSDVPDILKTPSVLSEVHGVEDSVEGTSYSSEREPEETNGYTVEGLRKDREMQTEFIKRFNLQGLFPNVVKYFRENPYFQAREFQNGNKGLIEIFINLQGERLLKELGLDSIDTNKVKKIGEKEYYFATRRRESFYVSLDGERYEGIEAEKEKSLSGGTIPDSKSLDVSDIPTVTDFQTDTIREQEFYDQQEIYHIDYDNPQVHEGFLYYPASKTVDGSLVMMRLDGVVLNSMDSDIPKEVNSRKTQVQENKEERTTMSYLGNFINISKERVDALVEIKSPLLDVNLTAETLIAKLNEYKDSYSSAKLHRNGNTEKSEIMEYALAVQIAISRLQRKNDIGFITADWSGISSSVLQDLQKNVLGFGGDSSDGIPGPKTVTAMIESLKNLPAEYIDLDTPPAKNWSETYDDGAANGEWVSDGVGGTRFVWSDGDKQEGEPRSKESYKGTNIEFPTGYFFPDEYRSNLIHSCREQGVDIREVLNHLNSEVEKYNFPRLRFIQLIAHESKWQASAKNTTSSAQSISQMIDGTWSRFGSGERGNMFNEITASLKYLRYISDKNGCSPEDACAFYNTGENFRVDDTRAPENYITQNTPIINKIPRSLQDTGITRRMYFIGAVAYYNSISYSEADALSSYGSTPVVDNQNIA